MTLDLYLQKDSSASPSSSKSFTDKALQKALNKIKTAVKTLKAFQNNYVKKFNVTNLAKQLKIPNDQINEFIEIILEFQSLFTTIFADYELDVEKIEGIIYLTAAPKESKEPEERRSEDLPGNDEKTICLTKEELCFLNDIIYTFYHVRRGKGFDLKTNGSQFLSRLKTFHYDHSEFFEETNNLLYPSKIGLEIGTYIQSLNKLNKKIHNFEISNYKVVIQEDGKGKK